MTFKVVEPPVRQKFDKENGVHTEWVDWTLRIYTVANAVSQSGATRPAKIYVGQMFFDTSLGTKGKPIWVGSDGTWIDSSGASV